MKANKDRSASGWLAAIFEGTVRTMVGCFVLLIVFIVVLVFVSDYHFNPLRGRLPTAGPHVPIPSVNPATIVAGRQIYLREDCSSCHALTDADSQNGRQSEPNNQPSHFAPNLTHEGQRNADIDWQMSNLGDHHRLYPNSAMPDYTDLSPTELKALATFLATRR